MYCLMWKEKTMNGIIVTNENNLFTTVAAHISLMEDQVLYCTNWISFLQKEYLLQNE